MDITRALRIGSRINQGTSGSILFVDSSGNIAQANSNFFWDNANKRLGIGTASPDSPLHINSNNAAPFRIEGTLPTIFLKETDGSVDENFQMRLSGGKLIIQTQNDAGSGASTKVTIQQDGNVGIGASSPIAKLHINTGSTTKVGQIIQGVASQSADLTQWKNSAGTVLLEIQADGELGLIQDSKKMYFGLGRDMSLSYDGTKGVIKTDEVAASDLHIGCGANKTLVLDNPVYEDLPFFLSSARVPAANAPSWESLVGNLNAYAYDVNDFQEFSSELLHGYKEGSTLEFHIHGALNATLAGGDETVKFEVEYSIANMDSTDGVGDVFPATTTINQEFTVPDGTLDLTQIYVPIGTDATGNFNIGATIQGRVRRIASSGTELVGDIFLTQISIHYQKDTGGSRFLATK